MTIHIHPWNLVLSLKWIFSFICLNYCSILCNKLEHESHLSDSSTLKYFKIFKGTDSLAFVQFDCGAFSFKISLQVLITFVIINIGIIRDGNKMSSYIQIYLTWRYSPPSLLLTFRTWNSELCWNNNKYRPVIYNHLCNGEKGIISLHR